MNRLRAAIRAVACHEDVDFLLTNRIRDAWPHAASVGSASSSSRGTRSVDRRLAAVFRSEPGRGARGTLSESARLLHPTPQRRRTSHRERPESSGQPLRRIVARSSMDRRSSSSHRTDSPWWTVFSKVTGFVWVSRSCGLPTPMAGRVPPPESEPAGGQQWRERIPSQRPSSTVANPPLTTFLPSHLRTRIGRQFHLEDLSRAAHGTAA